MRATGLLRERGASQVVLFGSLARGDWCDRSDVDLLVAGLPEALWAQTWCDLELMLQVRVDLVRAETAPARLLARAQCEGVDIANETEAHVAG
jgi:predicted nucleotidyltransferase